MLFFCFSQWQFVNQKYNTKKIQSKLLVSKRIARKNRVRKRYRKRQIKSINTVIFKKISQSWICCCTMHIKHVTKIYPRIYNENILDFQISETKFQVLLSEVCLHFKVKLPKNISDQTWEIIPENLFGAKQFSSCEVKINDAIVGHRSMANQYAC